MLEGLLKVLVFGLFSSMPPSVACLWLWQRTFRTRELICCVLAWPGRQSQHAALCCMTCCCLVAQCMRCWIGALIDLTHAALCCMTCQVACQVVSMQLGVKRTGSQLAHTYAALCCTVCAGFLMLVAGGVVQLLLCVTQTPHKPECAQGSVGGVRREPSKKRMCCDRACAKCMFTEMQMSQCEGTWLAWP